LHDLLRGSETLVGSPIGFPSGGTSIAAKVAEAHQLVNDGAEEIDIVINIGRLLDGDHPYVARELREVLDVIPKQIVAKVIIETSLLNEREIREATQLVVESGAAFVKTGTGWAGPVSKQSVEIIASELDALAAKDVQIKAAGGITTTADIAALTAAGATRFGIGLTAAVSILEDVSKK
jgi:deoxyribose-phosphate aldolase